MIDIHRDQHGRCHVWITSDLLARDPDDRAICELRGWPPGHVPIGTMLDPGPAENKLFLSDQLPPGIYLAPPWFSPVGLCPKCDMPQCICNLNPPEVVMDVDEDGVPLGDEEDDFYMDEDDFDDDDWDDEDEDWEDEDDEGFWDEDE